MLVIYSIMRGIHLNCLFLGKISTVKFLIESGAKVDLKDDDGKNVLHKAVEYKHHDLVKMLLENHPDLQNVKDKKGLTPLEYEATP